MRRLFLSIAKDEELRFLGHLDLLRTLERVVMRSGLVATFSEGFNPHMRIALDAALGVGVACDPLYMELRIESAETLLEIKEKLAAACPPGIRIHTVIEAAPEWPKLINFLNEDCYEAEGPVCGYLSEAEISGKLSEFHAETSVLYERVTPKKTRTIDVKTILTAPVEMEMTKERAYLRFSIQRTATGSIQPRDLWKLFAERYGMPWTVGEFVCKRTGAFHSENGKRVTPLDPDAFLPKIGAKGKRETK